MTNSNRKRVCSVRLWRRGEIEQHPDHMLHLIFASPAGPDDRLFDHPGGIFVYPETVRHPGGNGNATGLTELQRRVHVAGEKHLFDSQNVRIMLFDETADRPIYLTKAFGEAAISGPDTAAGHIAEWPTGIHHAIARDPGSGIYTQNPPGIASHSGLIS